jgi:hypothetical protein
MNISNNMAKKLAKKEKKVVSKKGKVTRKK